MEIWIKIKDYEGYYEVSNYGNVRSLDRYVENNGGHQFRRGKSIARTNNGLGYLQVNLYKDGIEKKKYVHVLVAEAFLLNPFNLPDVDHKDTNKQNNHISNLEWCTKKENHKRAVSKKLIKRDVNGLFI